LRRRIERRQGILSSYVPLPEKQQVKDWLSIECKRSSICDLPKAASLAKYASLAKELQSGW
jgi:hypothetical protein